MNTISDKRLLELLMQSNGWTQKELAEQMDLRQSMVSRVVNEKRNMRKSTRKLAEILLNQSPHTEEKNNENR
jgi:transcriptional regulator with XRE-family HTH domain